MSIKYTIPGIYRANTLSLCAWIWIESAMHTNKSDPISIMDAARMFQQFWGLEEDDMDIYHIRQCYYRMQEANRERCEDPCRFPPQSNPEIDRALEVIKDLLTKNHGDD